MSIWDINIHKKVWMYIAGREIQRHYMYVVTMCAALGDNEGYLTSTSGSLVELGTRRPVVDNPPGGNVERGSMCWRVIINNKVEDNVATN